MENTIKDAIEKWSEITELYEVVETVEVVASSKIFRLEVIKGYKGWLEGRYACRGWLDQGPIKPMMPYEIDITPTSTPEFALDRGLCFLATGNY